MINFKNIIHMKKFAVSNLVLFLILSTGLAFSQTAWVSLTSNTTKNLTGVCFASRDTGIAIGENSAILRTTNAGLNWTAISSPVSATFKDIYFSNANTGYACGLHGIIIKTINNGQSWSNISISGDTTDWNAIFFISDTGWVTGTTGLIKKTTNGGNNWVAQNANCSSTYQFDGIYFLNSSTGYLCGGQHLPWPSNRIINKTTNGGVNWYAGGTSQVFAFLKIQFTSPSIGWTVGSTPGDTGCVSKTTDGGTVWSYRTPLSPGSRINSLYFSDDNNGYIVGNNGKIFHTTNGAIPGFIPDTSGTNQNLLDISYSGTALYAVGNNGTIIKKNFGILRARLNNIFELNSGRISRKNITLSDSLCSGTIDTVAWYVNNILVSNQHSFTYSYPQGTTNIRLVIKDHYGYTDFATAVVSRGIFCKSTQGPILGGNSLIGDSVLFAISSTDAIYKMDINGNYLLNLTVGEPLLSTSSISYDTMIFLTTGANNLYAFDKYFAQKWPSYNLGAVATTTPTIDSVSQRLFVGASNGNFFAINKNNGNNVWTFNADAPVKSSAVISKNKNNPNERKLLFVSSKGTIYGFNLNGQLMNPPLVNWVKYLSDSVSTSPAIDGKGFFWIGTKSGKLYRIRLNSNNTADSVLAYNFNSEITTSPVIDANNNIYVATLDKKLHSLKFNKNFNNHNFTLNWEYTSGSIIRSTPAISRSHRIYFGNDGGELIGVDTLNGGVKFYYQDSAHSKISCPILYKCGSIYAGNEAGKVFAFYDSTSYDTTQLINGMLGGVKSVPVWGVFQNNVQRNGVGEFDTLDTGVRLLSSNLPDKFELKQNYPNPFNPNTTINIQISRACEVRLAVYDVLGKEIDVLVNQTLKPGNYDVNWNAAKYSSGAYFYRIVAGDFVETKKMVILK
jgi:photosystem II stability/assembly factor-like uncharacterized protein